MTTHTERSRRAETDQNRPGGGGVEGGAERERDRKLCFTRFLVQA